MISSSINIAIIGGGPGGLTLARLLQLQGFRVTVFEKDAHRHVRQQGATLDLHADSGLKALRAAGLLGNFQQHYRPGADRIKITDQHGTVFHSDHDMPRAEDFENPHYRPEIDRGPLRDLLNDWLQPGTVTWDAAFESMKPAGSGWEILFRNGNTFFADLVIGADGAYSKVRPWLTPIRPVYSGITVIEGNVYNAATSAPKLFRLVEGGKLFAFGGEKSLILSAKGDGALSFYTGCREAENWPAASGIDFSDREQVRRWFSETFSEWDPLWQELITGDNLKVIPRPMYHFPLDQQWDSQSNLTLIGDAAHVMPPYAGEGVNMAMLDALELSEQLATSGENLQPAISAYEKAMLKRAASVTAITLEQTDLLHGADALQYMLQAFGTAS
ncbi:FAD-dependent oxidoreductase [Flavihumibacter petaseus]|uniref:Flavin-dependent monooxygenase n=1 Tax=Flavihumibacter petaseus NBRC 106054 TaxID=1220578 RepID=A0A0E9MZ51_9BACT|nr:NAD(P)/FAD-dependent oxidoreductase [Flavihumibacter petaseus]GAO42666.1 putative monooxygenase [Flavihumibacter petaseus NBRC 106054]